MTHKLTAQQRVEQFTLNDIEPELRALLERSGILDDAAHIVPFSLMSSARLKGIIRAVSVISEQQGDTAEIGCNAGGTSRLIALLSKGRRHWACDTFEGLVDAGKEDSLENGAFSNRLAKFNDVSERLSDLDVRVVCGYFPQCASPEMVSARYALVHIDVDTYRSMHACFAFFLPRMVEGGVMILDDVIGSGTEGGKLAWAEISARDAGTFEVIEQNDPQVILRIK